MLVDQAIHFTASSALFRHSLYTYLFWHSLFFKSGLTSQSAHYLVLLLFHYEHRNLKDRKTTTNLDTDHSVLYTELKEAAILEQIYKLTRKKDTVNLWYKFIALCDKFELFTYFLSTLYNYLPLMLIYNTSTCILFHPQIHINLLWLEIEHVQTRKAMSRICDLLDWEISVHLG